MSDSHWARVSALFDRLADLDPLARAAILDAECAEAPVVRALVERLLSADACDDGRLDGPARPVVASGVLGDTDGLPTREGEVVGPYRLGPLLGHGGMGDVYIGFRDDAQFAQRVALKLVRPELASPTVVARFLRERQILATLEHDGIARLLDGGMTSNGEPYFAMEYVHGLSITDYCDRQALDVHARLGLWCDVAAAVQFAHQHLVVHRDLKPSNILVTSRARVKLLDFGIARALDASSGLPEPATVTHLGWRPLTPDYAAPEQVRGDAVTTATDVYGLGAVLYELLAGRRPFAVAHGSAADIERVVCQTDAPLPSRVAPRVRAPLLRGDLDTIIGKALAKAPDHRYTTPQAMADDVARFLAGEPIVARRAGVGYRARKFVGRHAIAVAAAFVAITAGIAGAGLAVWQAQRANREASHAAAMRDFLLGLFEASSPESARRADVSARELIDRGVATLDTRLAAAPEVRTDILLMVGDIYRTLGDFERSVSVLTTAVASLRAQAPAHGDQLAVALASLGSSLREQSALDRAEPLQREALALAEATAGAASPGVARAATDLAATLNARGQYAEAERLHRRALAIDRALVSGDHREVATDLDNLGVTLLNAGRLDAADEALTESLAMRRRMFDPAHPDVIVVLGNLAVVRSEQGRLDEAIGLQQEVLDLRIRTLGPDHPDVALSLSNLAAAITDTGRLEEGQRLHQRALDVRRKVLGPHHPDLAINLNGLAIVAYRRGAFDVAIPAMREAVALWRRTLGAASPAFLTGLNNLGTMLSESGQFREAEPALRDALQGRRAALGYEHPEVAASLRNLGLLMQRVGQLVEAEPLLREALRIDRAQLPADHPRTAEVDVALGGLLVDTRRAAEAEPLLREAVRIRSTRFGDAHPDTAEATAGLGACLLALGRPEGARPFLDAFGRLEATPGTDVRRQRLLPFVAVARRMPVPVPPR